MDVHLGAGRQLRQMSKSGMTVQFEYDHNDLRVGKTVNGVATSYTLHGKLITHLTKGSDNLHFFYDAQSRPAKVDFNGTMYTYVHNLQGDIVGLLDNSGALVVEYKYDAWGKNLSVTGSLAATLGVLNPFRYRGYVFDEETGLYYLRSRYYNPVWGRFINADELISFSKSICTHNLFCYCLNQPLVSRDEDGHSLKHILAAIVIAILIVKAAKPIITAIAAEAQLVVNRSRAKKALSQSSQKQMDYLVNVPNLGADAAFMEGRLGKYEWFYKQVNHGAPMDYKNINRRPWWAFGQDQFYFRGKLITFEEYGNINYGYVGKALGIPDWIIFAGGGYAAVTGGGDTSGGISCFFDSQEDHDNIAWGISIYNTAWGE